VTPSSGQTKVYGTNDPTLTYGETGLVHGVTVDGVTLDDSFSGALTRVGYGTQAGENVGNYAITLGTLAAGSNYGLSFTSGGQLTITSRPITVTANNVGKTLGTPDPTLTYQISAGNLVAGDSFVGAPARDTGQATGTYPIRIGTLSAGGNYLLTFQNGIFTIYSSSLDTENSLTASFTKIPTDVNFALGPDTGGSSLEGAFQPNVSNVTTASTTAPTEGVNPIVTGSIGTTDQQGPHCYIDELGTISCPGGPSQHSH
jgi:hypothetical protein